MRILRGGGPGTAAGELDFSRSLLRGVAAGELEPTLRVYRPPPTVAFGKLDAIRPGYEAAREAARAHGFEPVLRAPGGHAAAYHEQSLGLDRVVAAADAIPHVHEWFREAASALAAALASLGVDARVGAVPREYCPGDYSVNARGRVKLAGVAQRVVRGASLLGATVVVRDGARVRAVLHDVYSALELDWDEATAGAVEDEVPGVTVDDVERAVLAAFGYSSTTVPSPSSSARDSASRAAASSSTARPTDL
jgi:octanoyl-[GcvH]:protein N-octanoyltransferase